MVKGALTSTISVHLVSRFVLKRKTVFQIRTNLLNTLHKIILKPRPFDESPCCLKTKHYWHYQGEKLILSKMILVRDESHIYFCTKCVKMTLAVGGLLLVTFVLKKTKVIEFQVNLLLQTTQAGDLSVVIVRKK